MEPFPTIPNILDQTRFSTFQENIEKMPEKKRNKLVNEEQKALNEFRMKLLLFYEEHKETIRGEYTAELPGLQKEVFRMLKEYKDEILGIRSKHLKTDVPDEPLGVEIKPLKSERQKQKDLHQARTLRERIIAGDDLIRDVERLPKKYQEKIESKTEELMEERDREIQDAKEKRNQQRDHFWERLDQVEYDKKKIAIKQFDEYEEMDIKNILRKYEGFVLQLRRKYIELSRLPHIDINSPEADEYEEEGEEGKVKGDPKEKELDTSNLYTQAIIQEKIKIPFSKLSNNMTKFFESYAEKKIERKCRNEGYVRTGSSHVLSYSTGLLNSDSIIYNVVYSVDVCYPYENMEIECKIKNITKIGIRAIISENNNPIIMFISREHNPDKDFDQYKENQHIKVKVIGHRFELNDEYVSAIGELND